MALLTCHSYTTGSAVPPITTALKDDCGAPQDPSSVTAEVYDIYGTLQGTYSLTSPTTGPHVVRLDGLAGVEFEVVGFPYLEAPGGALTVKWSGGAYSAWTTHTFLTPRSYDEKTAVISWSPVSDAARYAVYFAYSSFSADLSSDGIDEEGRRLLGYTTGTVFTAPTPIGLGAVKRVNDDAGNTWEVYIADDVGRLNTRKVGVGTVPPVYVLGSDGSSWELTVVNASGNLLTSPATEDATTLSLQGPTHAWSVSTTDNGTLVTTLDTLSGEACGTYCVEALSKCIDAGTGTYASIKTLTVANGDVSVVYTSKPVCLLTGQVLSAGATARTEHRVLVHAHWADSPQFVSGALLLTENETSVALADNGRFSIPLMQGATVIVEIPGAHFARRIVVPSAPQADLSTIAGVDIELRRGE